MISIWTHKFTADVEYRGKNYGGSRRIKVEAGLHLLGGNPLPHFSVTAEIYRPKARDIDAGGCLHEEVLKYWPSLKPIIDLHLSDSNGVPMHAGANGWYHLAGYLGGAGERYHGGNSKQNFDCAPPEGKTWPNYEHRLPTFDECLAVWADHVRIPFEQAKTLADGWQADVRTAILAGNELATVKMRHKAWIVEQGKRWKAEAEAGIALLDAKIAQTS